MQHNPSGHENKRKIDRVQNDNIRAVQNINRSDISEPGEDPHERNQHQLAQIIAFGLKFGQFRRTIHVQIDIMPSFVIKNIKRVDNYIQKARSFITFSRIGYRIRRASRV